MAVTNLNHLTGHDRRLDRQLSTPGETLTASAGRNLDTYEVSAEAVTSFARPFRR